MAAEEQAALSKVPYYHGLLPREDLKTLLKGNGEFLVRMSEPSKGQPRQYILSAMSDNEQIRNIIILRHAQGKYSVGKYSFDTVAALIDHHVEKGDSVTEAQPCIITTPIGRQKWELNHADIVCTKKLGEGAFGEVQLGTWQHPRKGQVKCAIKLAKLESMTKEQIKEIMREARFMRLFDHPNVVKMYGVAAINEPLMLVMELASNGALDSYLSKNPIAVPQKILMCVQAAWGLEYLHTKCILHRDIASRNCLYGDGQVKIADFGLSRQGPVYKMDPNRRVPIRWLAPETMRTQVYNFKTDVYSFGIMVWEIFHDGREPFTGMTAMETAQNVLQGYRMPFEPHVPLEYAKFVLDSMWDENPDKRMLMEPLSKELERMSNTVRPNFAALAEAEAAADAKAAAANKKLTKRAPRKKKN